MLDNVLSIIAPHHCYGCTKLGVVLCDNCKYNITIDQYEQCILCGASAGKSTLCGNCSAPFSRAWCAGERQGVLLQTLNAYKFERVEAAYKPLASLLADITPQLPSDCVVVPIPTIPSHVRQRGYDSVELVARQFAKQKNVRMERVLQRRTTTIQTGRSRKQRLDQAADAFQLKHSLGDSIYLLVDDVVTTGATLISAARLLREGGAREVWVAALARQPLD